MSDFFLIKDLIIWSLPCFAIGLFFRYLFYK
jgi:hypothetical protein